MSLNCCRRRELKVRHGSKMIAYRGNYYLKNEPPDAGQGPPFALPDGTPICFVAWYMEVNECPTCCRWRLQADPKWS